MSTPSHTGAPFGGDPVNDPKDRKPKKSRSKFDLTHKFATTLRFGECSPFLYLPAVAGSQKTVRSAHLLRSLSLASPLLQNLRLKKDYFAVRMRALLPKNWDLIFTNPLRGDDIDASKANTLMPNLLAPLKYSYYWLAAVWDAGVGTYKSITDPYRVALWLRYLLGRTALINSIFAKDSLFAAFRLPIVIKDMTDGNGQQLDSFKVVDLEFERFHQFLDILVSNGAGSVPGTDRGRIGIEFGTTGGTVYSSIYQVSNYDGSTWTRNYSERMRLFYDYLEYPAINNVIFAGTPDFNGIDSDFSSDIIGDYNVLSDGSYFAAYDYLLCAYFENRFSYPQTKGHTVNWAPILAYQLSCIEFYTNDAVDDVYSTDLFRGMYDSFSNDFSYNGVRQRYDGFSYDTLDRICNQYFAGSSTIEVNNADHGFYMSLVFNLITRKRSLKFIDYFVGSRTRPLAVVSTGTNGDISIAVNNNEASVIDVTRAIQAQRFLTQVNRVGRRVKDYLKGIFDTLPAERTDIPVLLGSTTESIYGVEVQNTGQDQLTEPQTITTNFQSGANNFAFEISCSEESIIVGICYFDIARFYDRAMYRLSKVVDRFDMFNPYFQFIGDQPLYKSEYDATDNDSMDDTSIFGYVQRDQHYKTLVDYCSGDFVGSPSSPVAEGLLKSWIFKNDYAHHGKVIASEFIRSQQAELDPYYLSLTGENPADRYHFILLFTNHVDASEPMAFNPQIL